MFNALTRFFPFSFPIRKLLKRKHWKKKKRNALWIHHFSITPYVFVKLRMTFGISIIMKKMPASLNWFFSRQIIIIFLLKNVFVCLSYLSVEAKRSNKTKTFSHHCICSSTENSSYFRQRVIYDVLFFSFGNNMKTDINLSLHCFGRFVLIRAERKRLIDLFFPGWKKTHFARFIDSEKV